MNNLIDNFAELENIKDSVTFDKVRLMYGTGRSNTITTPQGKKSFYRNGVMTEIGDIKESVWVQLIEYLIQREDEIELFNQLVEWIKDTYHWQQTEEECKKYALELHAARIFDRPEWVDYLAFNKKYCADFIV